jgi:hypothetical protein
VVLALLPRPTLGKLEFADKTTPLLPVSKLLPTSGCRLVAWFELLLRLDGCTEGWGLSVADWLPDEVPVFNPLALFMCIIVEQSPISGYGARLQPLVIEGPPGKVDWYAGDWKAGVHRQVKRAAGISGNINVFAAHAAHGRAAAEFGFIEAQAVFCH